MSQNSKAKAPRMGKAWVALIKLQMGSLGASLIFGLPLGFSAAGAESGWRPFVVEVIDADTAWGVPLVELKSVHKVSWWTDNAGRAAITEPGWAGKEVFFHVASPGYEYPSDGMGFRGFKTRYVPGGTQQIQLKRTQLAVRMFRTTGEGLFRDTLLAGRPVPWEEGPMNAEVLGQDSVVATPWAGKIWWFWGDTDRLSYPLGHFGTSAATSEWTGHAGREWEKVFQYRYFTNADGFAKPVCRLDGQGLRWMESAFVLPEGREGHDALYARFSHQKDLGEVWAWHLMRWNESRLEFESIQKWDWKEIHDVAHPFRARDETREWLFLYPNQRVLPRLESVKRLEDYESFTCVAGDGSWKGAQSEVERDGSGRVVYRWKAGAVRLTSERVQMLVRGGKLKASETWMPKVDVETGEDFECGRHSVAWNQWLNRWLMIAAGKPGEVWISAADTPTGPWGFAQRVAVHGQYNFYNPVHHAFLDSEGGRVICFEGTYTAAFSGARSKTPRYDYNQLIYRLDLQDERLQLPVAIYRVFTAGANSGRVTFRRMKDLRSGDKVEGVAFWVRDRKVAGDVQLAVNPEGGLQCLGESEVDGNIRRLGWVSTRAPEGDSRFQPLFAWPGVKGEGDSRAVTLRRESERVVVAYVWRNPVDATTWSLGLHP